MTHVQHDNNRLQGREYLASIWQAPPASDDAVTKILRLAEMSPQAVASAELAGHRAPRKRYWFTGFAVAASVAALAVFIPKFMATPVATDTTASLSADNDMLNTIFATNEEEETIL